MEIIATKIIKLENGKTKMESFLNKSIEEQVEKQKICFRFRMFYQIRKKVFC